MSNKIVKDKDIKENNNNSQIHMLITIITIAITCVFCSLLIIDGSNISRIRVDKDAILEKQRSELIKSYEDEESIKVDIEFSVINTTDSDYDILRSACNKYLDKENKDNETISVNTTVGINENLYVDNNHSGIIHGTLHEDIVNIINELTGEKENISVVNSIIPNTSNKVDYMHETGPIFFQDKILLRYINYKGEMQVVASSLAVKEQELVVSTEGEVQNVMTTEVLTYGRSELVKAFNVDTIRKSDKPVKHILSSNVLTEEEYLKDITDIFIEALKTESNELNQKFQKQALKYFTYDGYNNIIDSKNRIILQDNATVSVNIVEAGKSSNEISYKDRVFIQLKILNNEEVILTNIVVKLNDKSKVFDIDIL